MLKMVFIHIPKTSGTSVRKFLHQIDMVQWVRMSELSSITFKGILAGHIYYEHVKDLFPGAKFITMLRNPIHRAVSHFKHITKDNNHYLHAECASMSLSEFLSIERLRPTVSNLQTKYLASKPPLARVKVMELEDVEPQLDKAIMNLEEFFHVGFQDDHIKSIQNLFKKLGLRPSYVEQRVTEKYNKTISVEDRQLLAALNIVDMKLYNYAKVKYD